MAAWHSAGLGGLARPKHVAVMLQFLYRAPCNPAVSLVSVCTPVTAYKTHLWPPAAEIRHFLGVRASDSRNVRGLVGWRYVVPGCGLQSPERRGALANRWERSGGPRSSVGGLRSPSEAGLGGWRERSGGSASAPARSEASVGRARAVATNLLLDGSGGDELAGRRVRRRRTRWWMGQAATNSLVDGSGGDELAGGWVRRRRARWWMGQAATSSLVDGSGGDELAGGWVRRRRIRCRAPRC